MLKNIELKDYGEKVNSILNEKTICTNDYEIKIVRYTSTPPKGFRFVWVDEL